MLLMCGDYPEPGWEVEKASFRGNEKKKFLLLRLLEGGEPVVRRAKKGKERDCSGQKDQAQIRWGVGITLIFQ